jgi:phosphoribosylaminoimidazole carboxylase PurE protein
VSKPRIGIVYGSTSDAAIMKECAAILEEFEIAYEMQVMSAHRAPAKVAAYAAAAASRGIHVLIAGAGLAAHLAGAVAANTMLPVIGVPLDAGSLGGLDALLATVQMPAGVPVATVAIGKPGARNAAWLAMQILALNDTTLAAALAAYRQAHQRA